MPKIDFDPKADPARVMETVRATFESRDYAWERTGDTEATASEGGRAIADAALPVSQRLRVRIRLEQDRTRVRLDQQTVAGALAGAAASVGAGPWATIQLGSRFRKLVKAVRADLAAASL